MLDGDLLAGLKLGLLWLTGYARAVGAIARLLGKRAVRAWTERAAGAVLVGLGVRLALERR